MSTSRVNREALIERVLQTASDFVDRSHTANAEKAAAWSLAAKNMASVAHSLIGATRAERRRDG